MNVLLHTGTVHIRREGTLARWATVCGIPFYFADRRFGKSWGMGDFAWQTFRSADCRKCIEIGPR